MYPSNLKSEYRDARVVRMQNRIMYATLIIAGTILSLLALICFVAAAALK